MKRYYFIINPASKKCSVKTKKEIITFFDTKEDEAVVDFWTTDKTVDFMVKEAFEKTLIQLWLAVMEL